MSTEPSGTGRRAARRTSACSRSASTAPRRWMPTSATIRPGSSRRSRVRAASACGACHRGRGRPWRLPTCSFLASRDRVKGTDSKRAYQRARRTWLCTRGSSSDAGRFVRVELGRGLGRALDRERWLVASLCRRFAPSFGLTGANDGSLVAHTSTAEPKFARQAGRPARNQRRGITTVGYVRPANGHGVSRSSRVTAAPRAARAPRAAAGLRPGRAGRPMRSAAALPARGTAARSCRSRAARSCWRSAHGPPRAAARRVAGREVRQRQGPYLGGGRQLSGLGGGAVAGMCRALDLGVGERRLVDQEIGLDARRS